MTSDTPRGSDSAEAAGAARRRPTRRRATRPTAAPPTVTTPPELFGITLPARSDAGTPAPAEPTAAPVATEQPAAVPATEPAAGGAHEEPVAPPKRSRRATRPTGSAVSLDEIVLPARDTTPAAAPAQTPSRAGAVRSLDDIVLPAPTPVEEAAEVARTEQPAEKPAKRATRSRRAAAAPAEKTEAPVDAEQAAEQHAAEPVAEPAEEKPRRRGGRASRAAKAPEPAVEAAPTAPSAEETAPAAPSPVATGAGSGTPRLATTALLFQAPDLSRPRRTRRAQAPAGPPRPHEEPPARPAFGMRAAAGTAEQPTEQPTEQPEEQAEEQAAQQLAQQRPAQAAEPTEPAEAPEPTRVAGSRARAAEPRALELTEDDAAAVEEVGAIEEELLAEGVELVDLGPEDLLEDDVVDEEEDLRPRRRRRRGGRGRRGGRRTDADFDEESEEPEDAEAEVGEESPEEDEDEAAEVGEDEAEGGEPSSRRRRRRRRGSRTERAEAAAARTRERVPASDEVTALKGSTRLEAKRQRRREGRDAGRRRQIITEAEFLARRESVTRSMVVREADGRTQIAVLEDGVLVEHYVSQQSQTSMVGNVYLGRVQNVLPSMEAAFVDIGKGRNAVLYAGEVNWDAAGLEGQPRRIEEALKSGDSVLVQVTKDPIGHKGARLTSQVTLAGRYLVFVPGGGMTGISRKLPDTERNRLKKILREVVPDGAGVIVRTAAEGASDAELRADVERLQAQWDAITAKAERSSTTAPALLQGEPDLAIRVVRDIFNDDFSALVVQGDGAWDEISHYVEELAPDLRERVSRWTGTGDVFAAHRVDEQLAKGMDRKVWLPSGGSLVIDRTEAMTVIDVNTGKFTGAGGTLEETVTRNNLEAAEEIVRQLRLRDIGGIIVIDFIDMVLESNRDLVLRRLVECLGRDRTKHQVAEVTSLGLVQMTRKRVGQGLVEAFSETCEHCKGRGFVVHSTPIERAPQPEQQNDSDAGSKRARRKRGKGDQPAAPHVDVPRLPDDKSEARAAVKATLASIAAAAAHAHEHKDETPVPVTADVAASPPEEPVATPLAATSVEAASTPVEPVEPAEAAATPVEPVASPDGEAPPKGAEAEEPAASGAVEAAEPLTE